MPRRSPHNLKKVEFTTSSFKSKSIKDSFFFQITDVDRPSVSYTNPGKIDDLYMGKVNVPESMNKSGIRCFTLRCLRYDQREWYK